MAAKPREPLSPREREALRHICRGLTTKEAAIKMGCSPRTVEDYRCYLLAKYSARNAVELVRAVYGLDDIDAAYEATSTPQ